MGRGQQDSRALAPQRREVFLAGVEGRRWPVEPGVLDERARAAFLHGQCHALALAVHEVTGWPIVGAEDESLDICHFLVRVPDGRLLDITGARTLAERQLEDMGWCPDEEYLVEQEAQWVRRIGSFADWRAPDVAAARSFVAPLLAESGLAEALEQGDQ
jgi:hypothetical protein